MFPKDRGKEEGAVEQPIAVDIRHVSKIYNTYRREFDRFLEVVSPTRKSYHQPFAALKDVNLQVRRGECVGIIGTNGSGKSTLLKIITGVLYPTTGEVKVEGSISSLLELGAGFNPNYTGMQNIYLNGVILGLSKEEMARRVPLIEEFAGIGEFIHQPVRKYSSGMFARLAFSVAIHVDPDVLIVDEALSVGDIFFQTKCYQKFLDFKRQGKTILFVTHDLSSVIQYCDRALLLNRGEQISVGPCKEVVDQYRKIMAEHAHLNKSDNGLRRRRWIVPPKAPDAPVDPEFAKLWQSKMLRNPNSVDYGDGQAEIADYGIRNSKGEITSLLMKGETYTILYRFRFYAKIDHPIFTFKFRDLKGTELCGTNTMYENRWIDEGVPGLTGIVKFTQRMTLQGGQYLLSLGLTGYINGELHAYHRLTDVCTVQVLSDRNTVGVFDVETQVDYEDVHVEADPDAEDGAPAGPKGEAGTAGEAPAASGTAGGLRP